MYYIINPLTWPFTVIPNLPQNLIEVIDSPLPLLIGMLGNEKLAKEIDKIREGNNNIILIENEKFKYYKEEKINIDKEPLNNLSRSLKQNYLELTIESNKTVKNSNYRLTIEICQKIDKICDKQKNQLRKSVLGTSVEALSSQELELRQKLKEEFINTYSNKQKKVDFYRIFPQTQIFAAYLDKYIENNR